MAWSTDEIGSFVAHLLQYYPAVTPLQADTMARALEDFSCDLAKQVIAEYWKWRNPNEAPSLSTILERIRTEEEYAVEHFRPDPVDRTGPRMPYYEFAEKRRK